MAGPELKIKIGGDANELVTAIDQSKKALSGLSPQVDKATTAVGKLRPASNQANFALTNLSRVAQDAPFGFIGIANNIEPLLTSFQSLKKETGSTKAALSALGSSLLGGGGLILLSGLATAALTLFGDKLFGLGGSANKAQDELNKFISEVKTSQDVLNDAAGSTDGEIQKVRALSAIVNNSNLSYQERNRALNDLKGISETYFGNLSLEATRVQQNTSLVEKYTEALIANATVKGFEQEITKTSVELNKQKSVLDDLKKQYNAVGSTGKTALNNLTQFGASYQQTAGLANVGSQAEKAYLAQVESVKKLQAEYDRLVSGINKAQQEANKFAPVNDVKVELDLTQLQDYQKKVGAEIDKLKAKEKELNDLKASGVNNGRVTTELSRVQNDLTAKGNELLQVKADITKAINDKAKVNNNDSQSGNNNILDNIKKLQAEYKKLSDANLKTNIDSIQKELDDRRSAASVFGSEESANYKALQLQLYNLKRQRIDNEYKAERDSLIKLGALTSQTGKAALAELEKNYNSKILQLKVEVQPLSTFNSSEIGKGITDEFSGIKLSQNLGFESQLAQQLGASLESSKSVLDEFWNNLGVQVQDGAANIGPLIENSLISIADTFGSVIGSGGTFATALAKSGEAILKIIGAIFQDLGKQMIYAGKLKIFLDNALSKLFGPQGGPLAIAAGFALVTLGAVFRNIKLAQSNVKAFAEGGIVTGPTMGLVGEAGKEAIIPLDRIGEVLGSIGGSQNVFVTGQLSGEVIYLQQQRVSQRRGRFV